ncbi:MAG TPA: Isoquinoline 1-oxidoreductase subunit [Kofleriaceae bacterium]|jgi:hypothetical protein
MRPCLLALVLVGCGGSQSATGPVHDDRAEHSRALWADASRVFMHPRCVNCHPANDEPHQRLAMEIHDPPVVRGPDNNGVPGAECSTCHQDHNQALTRVPGAPKWHLAPIEMAWVGKSSAYICKQIQDPARNGGKTLAQIVEHVSHDPLVGWGWAPGADREPVPGTQAQFGALVAEWVATGAECPEESR